MKLTIPADASEDDLPLMTLLTGETVEVVDVALGPHHHLEGRDDLAAGGAVARRSKQSAKEFQLHQLGSTPTSISKTGQAQHKHAPK